jgi:hypothetical protein
MTQEVIVYSDFDNFELASELVTLRPVFHKLDGGDYVVCGVALDGDLRIDGAHERTMAARACSFVPAVVHNNNDATEGVPDCIGGLHIGGHVAIVAFGPGKGAV